MSRGSLSIANERAQLRHRRWSSCGKLRRFAKSITDPEDPLRRIRPRAFETALFAYFSLPFGNTQSVVSRYRRDQLPESDDPSGR
jgi:hypothetical protein